MDVADRFSARMRDEVAPLYKSEGREAYGEAMGGLNAEFAAALADEYLDPAASHVESEVFSYAWAKGHSSGYGEVEGVYSEVAEIANAAAKG